MSDEKFDSIYPQNLRHLSQRHFSSIKISTIAAKLLVNGSSIKILDIGSGVGKFCLIASQIVDAQFFGIEHRLNFHELASNIAFENNLKNVKFMQGDFASLDFSEYDGFYFYNSFEEYINKTCIIDNTFEKSKLAHAHFHNKLKEKLQTAKSGARLVTYYTDSEQIPDSFKLHFTCEDGLVKLWIKG